MKKVIFTYLVLAVFTLVANAQQISLFDIEGEARAYIDYEKDTTIFMWDGTPVAFIEKDHNKLCVFGYNGSFLGWFEDGIIYDKKGYIVGAKKGAVNRITKMERIKGMQKMIPMRPMTPMTPMQAMRKSTWSKTSLTEYLNYGKK